MATVIGNSKGFISTIEHFLSTIYAYGIDNLRVIVNGNEMPIMDGSASPFCMLLDEVGIKEQDSPKRIFKIKKAIESWGFSLSLASQYSMLHILFLSHIYINICTLTQKYIYEGSILILFYSR